MPVNVGAGGAAGGTGKSELGAPPTPEVVDEVSQNMLLSPTKISQCKSIPPLSTISFVTSD